PPKLGDLALLLLEEALVLVELVVEALERSRVARHALLRVFAEHAAQAVDGGVEVVDLDGAPGELLGDGVPLTRAGVISVGELAARDGQRRDDALRAPPLLARLGDLALEVSGLLVVETAREREAHLADSVEE